MTKNTIVVIIAMFLSGVAIGGTPTIIQQQQVSDMTRHKKFRVNESISCDGKQGRATYDT